MEITSSIKISELLNRYFKNESDSKILVEQIDQMMSDKVESKTKGFASKAEVEFFRKDLDIMKIELSSKIENSSLRVESNLKSEINKLIIWIVATMLASGALFITLAKLFFDK